MGFLHAAEQAIGPESAGPEARDRDHAHRAQVGGAPADALRFAIEASNRDPSLPQAAKVLAVCLGSEVAASQQLALWANAARLAPDDVDVGVCLAHAASDSQAYHVGVTALERVREYHSNLPADFHLTLGWLYLVTSRLDDALVDDNRYVKLA